MLTSSINVSWPLDPRTTVCGASWGGKGPLVEHWPWQAMRQSEFGGIAHAFRLLFYTFSLNKCYFFTCTMCH